MESLEEADMVMRWGALPSLPYIKAAGASVIKEMNFCNEWKEKAKRNGTGACGKRKTNARNIFTPVRAGDLSLRFLQKRSNNGAEA